MTDSKRLSGFTLDPFLALYRGVFFDKDAAVKSALPISWSGLAFVPKLMDLH